MNTLDERVKDAVDKIVPSDGLNEATLERIFAEEPARKPRRQSHRVRRLRTAAAIAACMVAVFVGVGAYAYAAPTAYVQLDMNPSVEMQVNRFDTVVKVEALNDDGKQLLDEVSVTGEPYAEAVSDITESDAFLEYVDEESYLEISVVCDNDKQAQNLLSASEVQAQQLPCSYCCQFATDEERNAAWEADMGVGRYRLACQLMELDESVTLDDCASMTMWELRGEIEALGGDVPDSAVSGYGTGYHGGQGAGAGQGYHGGQGQGGNGAGRGQGAGAGNGAGPGSGSANCVYR